MDNVFKYFNGFFKGLTGLLITLLGLGVAVEVVFGMGAMGGNLNIIENVQGLIDMFAGGGFAGLVALCVLFSLLSNNK